MAKNKRQPVSDLFINEMYGLCIHETPICGIRVKTIEGRNEFQWLLYHPEEL